MASNRSGVRRAVALDIPKAFVSIWHASRLHKLKSYGMSGQVFSLILSFLSNRCLPVAQNGKSQKEYPEYLEFSQVSILSTLFLIHKQINFPVFESFLLERVSWYLWENMRIRKMSKESY